MSVSISISILKSISGCQSYIPSLDLFLSLSLKPNWDLILKIGFALKVWKRQPSLWALKRRYRNLSGREPLVMEATQIIAYLYNCFGSQELFSIPTSPEDAKILSAIRSSPRWVTIQTRIRIQIFKPILNLNYNFRSRWAAMTRPKLHPKYQASEMSLTSCWWSKILDLITYNCTSACICDIQ